MRVVQVQRNVMRKNDLLAGRLREHFAADGTFVVNLLSSPGAGKTTLLELTLERLGSRYRCGALVGDQATDNDARRLERSGAPVYQITTASECRLDAAMIDAALKDWQPGHLDALFIENVGNLICPAEYDLGESLRVTLFSVTEGEDKPLKYPLAFNTAQVAVISKIDIAEAVGFQREAAYRSLQAVNPDLAVFELSAKTGSGVDAWIDRLIAGIERRPAALAAPVE